MRELSNRSNLGCSMQKRKHGKSRVEQCLEHSIRQDLKIKRLQERLRAIEQLLRVSHTYLGDQS